MNEYSVLVVLFNSPCRNFNVDRRRRSTQYIYVNCLALLRLNAAQLPSLNRSVSAKLLLLLYAVIKFPFTHNLSAKMNSTCEILKNKHGSLAIAFTPFLYCILLKIPDENR